MKQDLDAGAKTGTTFNISRISPSNGIPHIHRGFEVSCILDGPAKVSIQGSEWLLKKYDIFVVNPYESHEINASGRVNMLSLRVSCDFFASFYPEIDTIYFDRYWILKDSRELREKVFDALITIEDTYLKQETFSDMKCHALINELFIL